MENVDFSAEDLRKRLLKTEVDLRVFMAKAPRRQKDAEKLLEEILYLERRIQALAAVEKIERDVKELTASRSLREDSK
jgi:5,10-methylenetetrahydrofolate reductase